jgi:hypothetical protein
MSATFGFGMLVYGIICLLIASIITYYIINKIK